VRRVRRSIAIKTIALSGSVLLVLGIAALLYQRSPMRGLPYHDQFAKGRLGEWQEFGGTWSIVDGALRDDSDERGAKLITGSPYWTDYQAETDVQLLGRGDAGLVIRATDPDEGVDSYRGYYAGLRIDDQSLVLGRAEYGWLEFPPVRMPGGVDENRWYHLTLSAVGCNLEASATALDTGEGTHVKVYDPNCPRSGKIGVRAVGSGGIWRNVLVQRLKGPKVLASASRQPTPSSLYPTSQGPAPRIYGIDRNAELLLKNSTASNADVLPIASLRLLAVSRPIPVSVSGTVTLTSPQVYIQDATAGAEVSFTQETSLKLGDEVEVTGDAHLDGLSLLIENASERSIAGVVPVPALSITPLQAAMGRYDAMFVELEGRLESKSRTGDPIVRLELSGGQQEFYAISNSRETATRFAQLKDGSTLRMRGICRIGAAYTENKLPFALIVRSPDDLEVLAGPPWWTGEHLALMAVGMLALGFLIHLLYSHADERRRTAVLNERERLAQEMHDTLAQSFAGLDFKLRAIRNRTLRDKQNVDPAKLQEELQEACDLVRHSHDEARRSLASLRPQILEKQGLSDALTQVGNRMTAGSSMQFKAEIVGQPRQLPVRIADAFFRIGQEAIANAVQHSHAQHLHLNIDYHHRQLIMVVEDDGRGFRVDQDVEGFGLTGMRRRAEGIHAKLRIESNGKGARITVAAPCETEPFQFLALSSYAKKLGTKRFNGDGKV
jgi:signal transduction histidine kinase